MSVVVVGAGSNLGARESAIVAAATLLDSRPGIDVVDVSPLYETPPLGPPQDDYLNGAFRLETTLAPPELLRTLLRVERRLGRRRRADLRWAPRSIDLDLLWDSRGAFQSDELDVPHRELERRSFALGPMLDVAPELDERYGPMLEAVGGRPARWANVPMAGEQSSTSSFERTVEAQSIIDACASSVRTAFTNARPWATRHVTIPATFEAFAKTVRLLFRDGFQCCCTTISHCSQSQWSVEFHGINRGASVDANVRLQTTLGDSRGVRVIFVVSAPRHK
jgi:2-amino-4-hydroxy-6-hydroxymethyldihydropteridine diphosphokinase